MVQFLLSDLVSSDILQEIQDAFSRYSGMAALITDANGTPLTTGSNFTHFCMDLTRKSELGCKNCEMCDRQGAIMTLQSGKPVVYSCHAGLTDYAAPIMVNDEFLGSFIGGQVRTAPVDEASMRQIAVNYGIDPDEYVKAAKSTNQLELASIERAAHFLSEITGTISKIALEKYQTLQQKQVVEHSARTQSDYLRSFSDDLKQNLTEMIEYMDKVNDPENEEDREMSLAYASVLISNTMSLGSMLDETIDFMQVEGGNFTLRENVYNIQQMVEHKVEEFRYKAAQKKDTISFSFSERVPRQLMGDSARISTMLGIFLENSIKYTESQEIHIHVDCAQKGYTTVLQIVVSDNGVGIEEAQLEKIRDYMLSRGKSFKTTPEFEDLGFSLVGYTVNAMHGTLDVTSKLGEGTTFTVTLPQLTVEK